VTGGVTLQRATALGGPFTDWAGSAAGIYHGGSKVQSHVKCATGNTTIQAVKIKMKGQFAKGSYSASIAASGPSNYWQLDETSGLVAKDLIGGANGTISGGVTLNQPGAIVGNTAMIFDGVTGKIVTAANVVLPAAPWTVEGWLRFTASGYHTLMNTVGAPTLGANNYVAVFIVPNGTLTFRSYDGAAVATNLTMPEGDALSSGVWHYLVVTVNGTTVTPYIDGAPRAFSAALPSPLIGTTLPLEMGAIAWQSLFLNGGLDDIAIYPRALSPTEISTHYAAR